MAMHGVWTPNAQVLCWQCHGPTFHYGSQRAVPNYGDLLRNDRQPEEGEAGTFCDQCSRETILIDTVAREHNLMWAIQHDENLDAYAEMAQTGGMCSAVAMGIGNLPGYFDLDSARTYILIVDRANLDGEDGFSAGLYQDGGEYEEEGVTLFETDTYDTYLVLQRLKEAVETILAGDDSIFERGWN